MKYTQTITPHSGFNNDKNMKVTQDNFVWKLVTEEQAEIIFSLEIFDLYAIYYDDSESLIENYDEIRSTFAKGIKVGIEVGFIKK
jgi:hypothetical protein